MSFLLGCACAVVWVLHVLPLYVPMGVQVVLAWVVLWVLVDLIMVQPSSWTKELQDIKFANQAVFALQKRIEWRLFRLEGTVRSEENNCGLRKSHSR